MPNLFRGLFRRKWLLSLVVIGVAVAAYFLFFKRTAAIPQYILTSVHKGDLVVSVSGTGQVSAVNQIGLKAEGSGKVTFLNAKVGQNVKAGDKLAVIDQKSNELALLQARASVASAQANYNKVVAGTSKEDLRISQLSVESAQAAYDSAKSDLEQTKKSAAENIAQAQNNLNDLGLTAPYQANTKRTAVINSSEAQLTSARNSLDLLQKILDDNNAKTYLGALNSTYLDLTKGDYTQALSLLPQAQSSLSAAKADLSDSNLRQTKTDTLSLLNKTLSALLNCYQLLDNSIAGGSFTQATLDSYKASVNSQISSTNSGISSLQTSGQALDDAITAARNAITNAQLAAETQLSSAQTKIDNSRRSLENAQAQYAKVSAPADASSLRQAQSQLISAQAQLNNAQLNYSKNIIISPIDGQIAQVNISLGSDTSASSAATTGTAAITVITEQKIAVIQLNEVDTAKLRVGQKTELTFDAIPDLKIKGTVSEIAGVGTITQGVVNYDIKISLDTQDERIKPGMSVSATIVTEEKKGVLLASNEAIKSMGDRTYVEMVPGFERTGDLNKPVSSAAALERKTVTVGAANDDSTEILSGLDEGDALVLRTLSTSSKASNQSGVFGQSGGARIPGGGFGR